MLNRAMLKQDAKARFAGHRTQAMAIFVIYAALQGVLTSLTYGFGALLLMPPLSFGLALFCLAVWHHGKPDFTALFSGFHQYAQALLVSILSGVMICLWSLLLIVPGVIKALAYSQARYLAAEHPHLDAMEAISLSKKITNGHKGEIFVFYLSFLGWLFLSLFTFGLLYVLYVGPYMEIAQAGLYEELKNEALANGTLKEYELAKPLI